jgi:ABC-type multidrug transport system ATPase subunit
MIELQHLTKAFGERKVLDDLSYTFPDKGLFYLQGENQAGKTTLFYILAFLDEEYTGHYYLDGKDGHQIARRDRNGKAKEVQLLFSHSNLLPHFPVRENLRLFSNKGFPVSDYKELLGQDGNTLSGGEEILFALDMEKHSSHSVLLLDEVTSALSDQNFRKTMEAIRNLSLSRLLILNGHDERMEGIVPSLYLKEGKIHD